MGKRPVLVSAEAQHGVDAAVELVKYEAGHQFDTGPIAAMRDVFREVAAPEFDDMTRLNAIWGCLAFMKVPRSVGGVKASAGTVAQDLDGVLHGTQRDPVRLRRLRFACIKYSTV